MEILKRLSRMLGALRMPGKMAADAHDTSRQPLDTVFPAAAQPAQITWHPRLECGHPVIDAQHRQLFRIGDGLVDAVRQGLPRSHIEPVLEDLVEHIKEHFSTEEALLARTRYPLSKEHQAMHGALLRKAESLRDRYRAGRVDASELVHFIAHEVVAGHIVHEDLRFALQS